MVEVYTHELGGESSRAFLEAAGILAKEGQSSMLQPRLCPMCNHQNRPEDRFCSNTACGLPLNIDGFQEMKEKELIKDNKLDILRKEFQNPMSVVASQGETIEAIKQALASDPSMLLKMFHATKKSQSDPPMPRPKALILGFGTLLLLAV
jgi:hypothetical protein